MTTYESDIKTIAQPKEEVFNTLSDLTNLRKIQHTNVEGREKIETYFNNIEFERDAICFSVTGIGRVGLRITEREPFDTIKFEAANSPFDAEGSIQLTAVSENITQMKITIRAKLPMMVKMMMDSKLKQAVNTIAETLSEGLSHRHGE